MEVETRLPTSPGTGPLGSGPTYSPITPEPQANDHIHFGFNVHANANGAEPSDGAVSDRPLRLDPSQGMNVEEKLRLGDHETQNPVGALDSTFQNSAHGVDNGLSAEWDVFTRAKATFQAPERYRDGQETIDQPVTEDPTLHESATSIGESEPNRIRAFAKLEFEDGQFYMNTYAIELGRDRDAAKQAELQMVHERDRKESEGKSRDSSNPDMEKASRSYRHEAEKSAAASVVSGGIMHVGDGEERPRRKKRKNKTGSSSSKGFTRQNSAHHNTGTDYQALANASLLDQHSARPVDLTNMMPSPDECPLIPIHPPNSDGTLTGGHKGISRKHVRIAYNHEKGLFELHVLGRNGCFIDNMYIGKGDVEPLASGTVIQIGGVSMRFVLPNVPDGETGTDLRSDAVSQSAMSFDFEDGRGESAGIEGEISTPTTDNEDDRYRELRLAQQAEAASSGDEEQDDDDDDDVDEDDLDEVQEHIQPQKAVKSPKKPTKLFKVKTKNMKEPPIKLRLKMGSRKEERAAVEEVPVKRKGPGRPPKNGIMSKREEAEIRRREKEAAKARKAEAIQVKKEEAQEAEAAISPTEKRKAQKKPKEEQPPEEAVNIVESIEKIDAEVTEESPQAAVLPKTSKEKRPPKPPRSPSPVWDESQLTAEQLSKPTQSYVVLIHEALSNHPEGRMSLPQIYRAIERKYPYYKLRVQTVGWQSSVRHNLSQHPAFVKIERDGKGWMWGLDASVSIEREKKRRPSPPPMPPQQIYNAGPNMFNRPYQQNAFPSAVNGQTGQIPPQNPYAMWSTNGGPAGRGFPQPNSMPRPPFPAGQQSSTYQSPYDTTRPQQASADASRPQMPSTQVPQIPPPYLNQNKSQAAQTAHSSSPDQLNGSAIAPPNQAISGQPTHVTQTGQAVQQPQQSPVVGHGSSAGTPATLTATNPYGIPPNILNATNAFRDTFIKLLASEPEAEAMVRQAVNKCLGIPAPAGGQYKHYLKENTILQKLRPALQKWGWPVDEKIALATGQRPIIAGPPSFPSPGAAPHLTPGSNSAPSASSASPVRQGQTLTGSGANQQAQGERAAASADLASGAGSPQLVRSSQQPAANAGPVQSQQRPAPENLIPSQDQRQKRPRVGDEMSSEADGRVTEQLTNDSGEPAAKRIAR